jgi:hypothetical protein
MWRVSRWGGYPDVARIQMGRVSGSACGKRRGLGRSGAIIPDIGSERLAGLAKTLRTIRGAFDLDKILEIFMKSVLRFMQSWRTAINPLQYNIMSSDYREIPSGDNEFYKG